MLSRRLALIGGAASLTTRLNAAPLGGVLVFGASGSSGSEFIKHLPKDVRITAFVRPTSNRDRLAGREVNFVIGDVLNEADVEKAFSSGPFDTVFVALQSRPNQPNPYVGAARHITVSAKKHGVKQVIWIGQVGASAAPINQADYPDINFKQFGPALKEMSAAEKTLIDSGVPYTVIRVGAVIVERGKPVHPETGKGTLITDLKRMGPIAYGDLGRLSADCAGAETCMNKVFHAVDDTLGAEYARWRCRRFAAPGEMDKC
jgi:uncharacterized protein YbjT (DUF2867 family)